MIIVTINERIKQSTQIFIFPSIGEFDTDGAGQLFFILFSFIQFFSPISSIPFHQLMNLTWMEPLNFSLNSFLHPLYFIPFHQLMIFTWMEPTNFSLSHFHPSHSFHPIYSIPFLHPILNSHSSLIFLSFSSSFLVVSPHFLTSSPRYRSYSVIPKTFSHITHQIRLLLLDLRPTICPISFPLLTKLEGYISSLFFSSGLSNRVILLFSLFSLLFDAIKFFFS